MPMIVDEPLTRRVRNSPENLVLSKFLEPTSQRRKQQAREPRACDPIRLATISSSTVWRAVVSPIGLGSPVALCQWKPSFIACKELERT